MGLFYFYPKGANITGVYSNSYSPMHHLGAIGFDDRVSTKKFASKKAKAIRGENLGASGYYEYAVTVRLDLADLIQLEKENAKRRDGGDFKRAIEKAFAEYDFGRPVCMYSEI